ARADYIEHFKAKADPKNPQHNALYAAMVKSLDDGVGRIVQAIDDAGIADNTIIVFYSDNGGYAYPPMKTNPEGYADIPATSNLPLRSGKASLYEGGTREPFILAWPGKAKVDATSDILFQSVDFYPTLLSFLGLKPHAGLKLDGLDQSKALLGGESARDRVFCHFPHGNAARDAVMDGFYAGTSVRKGDWKLIRFYARNDDGTDDLELYDLKNDLGERHNLAKEKPELVQELNAEEPQLRCDGQGRHPYRQRHGPFPLLGHRRQSQRRREGHLPAAHRDRWRWSRRPRTDRHQQDHRHHRLPLCDQAWRVAGNHRRPTPPGSGGDHAPLPAHRFRARPDRLGRTQARRSQGPTLGILT
ncbi:MAG: hypothetical protein EBY18_24265, partial [Alphaproteobacteria bacterium]|nr:hypothetical protein [Alphaproteobacteria bacterium]